MSLDVDAAHSGRDTELRAVLEHYDKVVVREMNLGQQALLLREKYLDAVSYTKVAGLPFKAEELQNVLTEFCQDGARW